MRSTGPGEIKCSVSRRIAMKLTGSMKMVVEKTVVESFTVLFVQREFRLAFVFFHIVVRYP